MLFTFPLRYWFTIGLLEVFSLTRWCWQIQAGFLRSRLTQDTARPQFFALTGLSPAMVQLSRRFSLKLVSKCGPTTPARHAGQVWAIPFSLATTWGIIIYFLFLPVLRCFSSRGWLPDCSGCYTFNVTGCPIRKSADIMLVCSSPQLIAAYHVLRRLSEPRHPPYALKCFKRVINLFEFAVTRHLQLFNPNMSKSYQPLSPSEILAEC